MKRLFLIIPALLMIFSCNESKPNATAITDIDSLRIKHDSLINVLNERQHCINYWYDVEFDGGNLIKAGIKKPVEFIEGSLRARPELIPVKATEGSKMNFDNIQILGREWLIADFDDGHIQGRAIYKYTLNKNNELNFELMNSLGPAH